MKALLADTLFKRLFALMWLALVISHAVAFLVVTRTACPAAPADACRRSRRCRRSRSAHARRGPASARARASASDAARRRPANPVAEAGDMHGPGGPAARRHGRAAASGDSRAAADAGAMPRRAASAAGHRACRRRWPLLDYGIRLLIIGLAAWLGARWLSAPMRRLQAASRTLGQSLARNEAPQQVDERAGTVEVRETAHVFNEMSRQLSDQVHSRGAAGGGDLARPAHAADAHPHAARSQRGRSAHRALDRRHPRDGRPDRVGAGGVPRRGPHEEPSEATDVHALVQAIVDDLADLGQPVSVRGEPAPAACSPRPAPRRGQPRQQRAALRQARRRWRCSRVTTRWHIVIEDEGRASPKRSWRR